MTANGYKCVGLGEKIPEGNVRKSDMLPSGWSDSEGVYSLIYQHTEQSDPAAYLLKVINVEGMLLVHLMRSTDERMADIELKTSDYVGQDLTSFDRAFKNLESLEKRFKTGVLSAFVRAQKSSPRQDERKQTDPRDSRFQSPHPQQPCYGRHDQDPLRDPFAFGRSDLDPLCGGQAGGGGMVFDPFRSQDPRNIGGVYGPGGSAGLPPGSVIPGARFDPYRPPVPDDDRPGRQNPGPDPDHMPPPGFDDMFM